jgi:hypothetical protein
MVGLPPKTVYECGAYFAYGDFTANAPSLILADCLNHCDELGFPSVFFTLFPDISDDNLLSLST